MSWEDVAKFGASMIPGVGSYLGSREANATNLQIAREQTRASQRMAEQQMIFQNNMSSTAHQREVKDLEKAGLNPLLALNSGASSPGGAMGSAPITQVQNELEGVATTGMEALRLKKEIEQANENIRNTKADTTKKKVETKVIGKEIPRAEMRNDMYDVVRPYIKKIKKSLETNAPKSLLRQTRP